MIDTLIKIILSSWLFAIPLIVLNEYYYYTKIMRILMWLAVGLGTLPLFVIALLEIWG